MKKFSLTGNKQRE